MGPGVGVGVGAGCTLFGIGTYSGLNPSPACTTELVLCTLDRLPYCAGWGFGGAPIGLWGMGAGKDYCS